LSISPSKPLPMESGAERNSQGRRLKEGKKLGGVGNATQIAEQGLRVLLAALIGVPVKPMNDVLAAQSRRL
jgi:hypothetical protein